MKIVFFGLKELGENYIKEVGAGLLSEHDVVFEPKVLDAGTADVAKDAEIVSVFVDSTVDSEVLGKLENVKHIATRSTGFDHIDREVCKERGITVSNVPSYGENTVAEFAFALIIEVSRGVHRAYKDVRETGVFQPDQYMGFDLSGKTLGVIGTGKIGRNSVKIGHGFGMKIRAFDVHPDDAFAKEYDIEYGTLDEVLSGSDIVTLHVPYMDATHHLMNKDTFSKMKKGSYLINTSRGPVVETQALVDALESGQLAGAGLDVLEEEVLMHDDAAILSRDAKAQESWKTILQNHKLIDMPNVIVTPHMAFNTLEARQRILKTTAENIEGHIGGSEQNIVK